MPGVGTMHEPATPASGPGRGQVAAAIAVRNRRMHLRLATDRTRVAELGVDPRGELFVGLKGEKRAEALRQHDPAFVRSTCAFERDGRALHGL
jgi:hypothetical protein